MAHKSAGTPMVAICLCVSRRKADGENRVTGYHQTCFWYWDSEMILCTKMARGSSEIEGQVDLVKLQFDGSSGANGERRHWLCAAQTRAQTTFFGKRALDYL